MSYFQKPVASIHDMRTLAARLQSLADASDNPEVSNAYERSAAMVESYGYEMERQRAETAARE